jgi:K+-sensing histidine kinase KdpD
MLVRERWTSQHDIAAVDATLGQVPADEQKVRQVIVNLLSDAIKFTPEVSRIEVGSAEAGTVEVSMSYTGVGITTEDQEADLQAPRDVLREAAERVTHALAQRLERGPAIADVRGAPPHQLDVLSAGQIGLSFRLSRASTT